MRTGRPKQPLTLTAEERERLESLAHRARTLPLLARRARIVLACADGLDNKTVARRLRASLGMVGKWRARFLQARLEGLYDEPRPGAPRTVSDAQVEHVVVQTLESTPRGATHWSTRGLAQATGLSRMTISRIWHAFGLQPHRSETFKLSPDPLFIESALHLLVDVWLEKANFLASGLQHEFPLVIDPQRACALDLQFDGLWVSAGSDDEVMFQLTLVAVIDQVNAGIDILVSHLAIGGDISMPFLRIAADEVVVFARQLLKPQDPWCGIGADELHAQYGRLAVANCRLQILMCGNYPRIPTF